MLSSMMIGLVGGQRALAPLAVVSAASARGELSPDSGAPALFGHPLVAVSLLALAAGEMAGDKQPSAPDRVVPIGLAARFVTSGIAGAALAPRRERLAGFIAGGLVAVAASYPGWRLRLATMDRYGQTVTGFVEDVAVLAAAIAIVRGSARRSAHASGQAEVGSKRTTH